jgi:flagella basal body P-ring formation protein FlgA
MAVARVLTLCGFAIFALLPVTGLDETVAAELRLRAQYTVEGPLVRLGDVAEIVGGDRAESDSLAATELFPAPAAREQRSLGVRELQDLLLLRGVNLAQHQFTGSSQVLVLGRAPAERAATASLPAGMVRRAQRRVCEAVLKYLGDHVSAQKAWDVQAEVSEDQVRLLLLEPARAITVSGGQPPWTGQQRFTLSIDAAQGPARLAVDAKVGVRAPAVVTVNALARGTVIREGDVELQQTASADGAAGALRSLEDAIGRETVRAVPAGKVLTTDALRTPPWVRRGEVVTVYARTAGIQIRTAARARDDGSQGDLVSVQSLLDRSTFYARVSGIREVEVFARSPRVETAEAGGPEPILRR